MTDRERRSGRRLVLLAAAIGGGTLLAIVAVLWALLAWAFKDFDDVGQPPARPTAAQLAAFERDARPGEYWLGRTHDGQRITSLDRSRAGASADYGEPHCDPGSGCSWDVSVGGGDDRRGLGSGLDDPPPGGWRACWQPLGRVWVLNCDYSTPTEPLAVTSVEVLTGDRLITVENLGGDDALAVARQLSAIGDGTPISRGQAPTRLTCAELAADMGTPRGFAHRVPAALRPTKPCR